MNVSSDDIWNYNIDRTGWWDTSSITLEIKALSADIVDNMNVSTSVSFSDLETVTINIAPKQA